MENHRKAIAGDLISSLKKSLVVMMLLPKKKRRKKEKTSLAKIWRGNFHFFYDAFEIGSSFLQDQKTSKLADESEINFNIWLFSEREGFI